LPPRPQTGALLWYLPRPAQGPLSTSTLSCKGNGRARGARTAARWRHHSRTDAPRDRSPGAEMRHPVARMFSLLPAGGGTQAFLRATWTRRDCGLPETNQSNRLGSNTHSAHEMEVRINLMEIRQYFAIVSQACNQNGAALARQYASLVLYRDAWACLENRLKASQKGRSRLYTSLILSSTSPTGDRYHLEAGVYGCVTSTCQRSTIT
jgi:hypothetical protein